MLILGVLALDGVDGRIRRTGTTPLSDWMNGIDWMDWMVGVLGNKMLHYFGEPCGTLGPLALC